MGRRRSYMLAFEGIVALARAPLPRDRQLEPAARADRGVHVASGRARSARARGSSPRCSRSPSAARTSTSSRSMSVSGALEFLDALELTETEQLIGARIVKEIRERLTFLENVGVGYLQLDRAAGDALGRRGAAAPARDADRQPARRRALHPRRAVDRPPPARQRPADRRRSSGCATSATPCSWSSTTSR